MDYVFHSDSGHGWLQVGMDEIRMLKLRNVISNYSYKIGNKVYLEEDCDASLFINAMENMGYKLTYKHVDYEGDCFIRNLNRYE